MRLFISTRFRPVQSIEWVLVVFSFFQGVYVFSPLYRYSVATNGATPFAAALMHPVVIYIFIGLLVISAAILAYGLVKNNPKLRAWGLFGQFLLRFYNVLTTILAVGFLPITWVYAATVVAIVVMLYITERVEIIKNAAH